MYAADILHVKLLLPTPPSFLMRIFAGHGATSFARRRLHRPMEGIKLSCFNVWWEKDLPWKGELLFGAKKGTAEKAGAEECGEEDKCLFTVLQSTSGITVANIAKQLNEFGVF